MPAPKRDVIAKPAAMALLAAVVILGLFLALGGGSGSAQASAAITSDKWTCSMCPQFILPEPGKCPKCFMDLIPLEEGALSGGKLELVLKPEAAAIAGIRTQVVEAKERDNDNAAPESESAETLIAVPATAVLENAGRHFVFTESEDGDHVIFRLREIFPAGRDEDMVLVASGLDEGESVAVAGVFRIDSALQILGKVSLVNLPDGDLADADTVDEQPFQPAERSAADIRSQGAPVDDWFTQYEQVRAALAHDDLAAARLPSRSLAAAVALTPSGSVDPALEPLRKELLAAATGLSQADSLSIQRDRFEKVSAEMVLLARRYGSPKGGLNLVFCPMAFGGAGAYWLQPQETVDNPYHGLEMPLCGWPVERIAE